MAVGLPRGEKRTPAELQRVYLRSVTGSLTPLAQVADLRFERAVPEMLRYDRTRCVTVTAWIKNGYNTSRVTQDALGRLSHVSIPSSNRDGGSLPITYCF